MEALIVILLALILCYLNAVETEVEEQVLVRATRLNPNFYKDENAFMEVADALGFSRIDSYTGSGVRSMRSEHMDPPQPSAAGDVWSSSAWDDIPIEDISRLRASSVRTVADMARSDSSELNAR